MTPDAFLQTIRENPDDDGPRLVYADWLEERGDPLGEFIRVQCELARADVSDLSALREREHTLLASQQNRWPAGLVRSMTDRSFTPIFRRGFVERIKSDTDVFVGEFESIGELCPLVRSAVLYNAVDYMQGLSLCPLLGCLTSLGIADWIDYADAQMLSNSRHLADLKSIWLWIRDYAQALEVGLALIDAPGLNEIALAHLFDSTHAQESPDEETRWRARVEDELNERTMADRGAIFSVGSSSNRLFPIRANPERGIITGMIAGRQTISVADSEQGLSFFVGFDHEGRCLGHQRRTSHRGEPVGFEPGTAHVREFVDQCGLAVHQFFSNQWEFICEPETIRDPTIRRFVPRSIHEWIEAGRFVLDWQRQYWLNRDGDIIS